MLKIRRFFPIELHLLIFVLFVIFFRNFASSSYQRSEYNRQFIVRDVTLVSLLRQSPAFLSVGFQLSSVVNLFDQVWVLMTFSYSIFFFLCVYVSVSLHACLCLALSLSTLTKTFSIVFKVSFFFFFNVSLDSFLSTHTVELTSRIRCTGQTTSSEIKCCSYFFKTSFYVTNFPHTAFNSYITPCQNAFIINKQLITKAILPNAHQMLKYRIQNLFFFPRQHLGLFFQNLSVNNFLLERKPCAMVHLANITKQMEVLFFMFMSPLCGKTIFYHSTLAETGGRGENKIQSRISASC